MSTIFGKPYKEFEVNGNTISVRPLPIGVVLTLKSLRDPLATAISKIRAKADTGYEDYVRSIPVPIKGNPDAMEVVKKSVSPGETPDVVAFLTKEREEGIKAIFDTVIQEGLLTKILCSSVLEFKGKEKEILDENSDYCVDLPTAMEIFGCIVDVNIGGFEQLGKYWKPLNTVLKGLQPEEGQEAVKG